MVVFPELSLTLLVDELAPGALTSTRGGRQTVAAEHFADGPVRAAKAQLAQLALDAPIPPARVLLGQLHDEVMQLAAEDRSLAARPSPVSATFGGLAPDASAAASPGWAAMIARPASAAYG